MSDFQPRPIDAGIRRDYGKIIVKLDERLTERGISSHRMKQLTEASYDTIKRYRLSQDIQKVDIDLLAKLCYILQCDLTDLLEYVPPQEELADPS